MAIENYEGYFDPDDDDDLENPGVVIDPAWERQQKKTFTAWCNAHLRKVNANIEVIENDFRSGLKLMSLLEVISSETISKPDRGKMRFHKIANVNKALNFIESKGVKLVSVGAEEIVDGNVKMTLGMIWTIILRFAIQDIRIEDFTAKQGLLLWCQKQTAPYKNVNVTNFSTSFKDGLAFCAIIHRNRPDLIDMSKLDAKNPLANLNIAFTAAEKELDIPRMIDPEDMVNSVRPDEKSVMAYVSWYYHAFSGATKAQVAANRIANLLKAVNENSRLVDEYESISSNLLKWITEKLKFFSARQEKLSIADVEQLQGVLRMYRSQEKPTKLEEKARMETTYNTLQTRLRLSNRVPYVPSHELMISAIGDKWDELEKADKAFEAWLLEDRQRLRRIDYLLKKFDIRCSTHEAWAEGKTKKLGNKVYLSANLTELRAIMKKHEAFEFELVANDDRIERIQALSDELEKLQYHDMQSLNARSGAIVSTTTDIKRLSQELMNDCNRILPVREKIDQLHLEFAKQAAHFNNWMDHTQEDLQDEIVVDTTAELQRYKAAHERFEETLTETDKVCKSISQCATEVEKLAREYGLPDAMQNPYTDIKPEELPTRWEQIQLAAKRRIESLREKEQQQMANDKMRLAFTEKATAFDQRIQKYNADIRKCATDAHGTLEQQRDQLKQLENEVTSVREMLNELEHMKQALEDYSTGISSYLPSRRVALDQLFVSIQQSVNVLENQIITRDSKGLTKEQMADIRDSFRHFDKDDSHRLDRNEFKACLLSLGHSSLEDSVAGETEFSKIMHQVDPGNKGYVTFDAFLDYMTRETADEDTENNIVQSFKVITGDKGYITADDLKRYLGLEDAQYCIVHMVRINGPSGDSGALNYEQFAADVYAGRIKN